MSRPVNRTRGEVVRSGVVNAGEVAELVATSIAVRRLGRHLSTPDGLSPDQVDDLRATLYGLDAILTLHLAQEEDYFTLAHLRR